MHSEGRGTKTEHDHHRDGVLRWSRRLEVEQPDSYNTNEGQRGHFGGTTWDVLLRFQGFLQEFLVWWWRLQEMRNTWQVLGAQITPRLRSCDGVCAVYCRSTTVFFIWFCTYISSMHRLTPLTRCLHIMIVARFNKPLVILIKKDNESNKKIKILWIQGKRKRLYPETKTDILDALTI